jgi:membrane fusion protein, heavy metal efflux system
MNAESRLQLRPVVVIVGAVVLIAAGAAATYFIIGGADTTAVTPSAIEPAASGSPSVATPAEEVTVTLSPDAIKRAGIEVQPVSSSSVAAGLRVPGTVQPDAYRTTVVTSLVGGRITRVSAELGQTVRRGQTLAEVYSPELAEAQTRFVASRAELEAHERELRRTERLVEIGAASRQELEKIHAEHTAEVTMVQSHRSRLTLLGMSESQIQTLASSSKVTATAAIPSPLDGDVTTREANVGMNVDPSMPLFTVADLSTVWIVGELNERDLARVRIGSPVIIAAAALPDARREGKISYIDPQIKGDTRTAQLRVEIPNPGRQLRLGMFVDMEVGEGRGEMAMTVPRSAVQMVGDRSVVYVANLAQPGQFTERVVETGRAAGESIEVVKGIRAGDSIVVKGSFAVRAESERLGRRAASYD